MNARLNPSGGAMTPYDVRREADGVHVYRNGRKVRHVVAHSPTGLETGYAGSGPADLALSVVCDYLKLDVRDLDGDLEPPAKRAWRAHHHLKWDVIANSQIQVGESYPITVEQILAALAKAGT